MTTTSDIAGLSEPDHIWLQNADDAKHQGEGRMWCEDKVWPDDPEDGEPTKYVRADLFDSLSARVKELEASPPLLDARSITELDELVMSLEDRALRAEQQRDEASRTLWFILNANGGFTLERDDLEDYPGADRAEIVSTKNDADGSVSLSAETRAIRREGEK